MTPIIRLWRALVDLGIDPATPAPQARSIALVNRVAAVLILIVAVNLPGFDLAEEGQGVAFLVMVSGAALMALVLSLNARRRPLAASVSMCVALLVAPVGVAVITQMRSGAQLFLFPAMLVAFFVVPPDRTRLAFLVPAVMAASYVALVPLYPVIAALQLDPKIQAFHYITTAFTIALFITFVGYYGRVLAASAQRRLARERQQSDHLLESVLPTEYVAVLRRGGRPQAQRHTDVTLVVADIVGFTRLAEEVSPEALVDMLIKVSSYCDELCVQYGLEKVRTVGDAFIVLAGAPKPRDDHALAALRFAVALAARVVDAGGPRSAQIRLRIGVGTGSVVTGVLGERRMSFEVWGDALTIAESLEAHGTAGEIHLCPATLEHLRQRVTTVPRTNDGPPGAIFRGFIEPASD